MKRLKTILLLLSLTLLALLPARATAGETAAQFLNRAAATVNRAGGIKVDFSIKSGGKTYSGTLQTQGKMFHVSAPRSSTWYNGREMWTYSAASGETTLVTPSADEIRESNPLSYIHTGGNYNAAFAKSSPAGTKTLILTPKKKNSGIKQVKLTVKTSTMLPTAIVVTPSSGQAVTLTVKSVKTKQRFPSSTFVYPKSKYKAKIIDLR